MTNYDQNRDNMMLGQFLPGLIKKKNILQAFSTVAREKFLPNQLKPAAYSDLNMKINTNRYIPSPFNTARIFQEADLNGTEVVLLVGANYGYEAVILASIVDTLVAIEEEKSLIKNADVNIKNLHIENLVLINKKHENGYKKLGPYDTIICLDSKLEIKKELIAQLAEGGKLFYCERQKFDLKESKLIVLYKSNNSFVKQKLFDINIPSTINTNVDSKQFNLI